MTNGSIRIAVAVSLFAATLLSLACAPTAPPNANVQNQNANVAQIAPARPDPPDPPECAGTDLGAKRDAVQKEINRQLALDGDLAQVKVLVQLAQQTGPRAHLEIGVEGRPKKKSGMKKLNTILEGFFSANCGARVVFVKSGTIPPTPPAGVTTYVVLDGFELLACDPPEIPCLGECRPPEQCPGPMPSPPIGNTNNVANRPPNTNSNRTSNSNGNN